MGAQLIPYIMSGDARAQAEFYAQALGGEIVSVMTFSEVPNTPEAMKDKVMHLALTAAGINTIFLSDSFEPLQSNRSIMLSLTYSDETEAREAFANLGKVGGVVKYPLEQQSWGSLYGEIIDRFGITWQIVKH